MKTNFNKNILICVNGFFSCAYYVVLSCGHPIGKDTFLRRDGGTVIQRKDIFIWKKIFYKYYKWNDRENGYRKVKHGGNLC